MLNQTLDMAPDRIYLNFSDFNAGNWGWNRDTFARTR